MARQQWSSRQTFIMAAIGSAVGLGNAWRFPGIAYQNGGGAFLIPYFVALLTAGIPLLALELSIGKRFQSGAPGALAKLNKKFEWIGWWGVVTAFCICAYYSVVLAWVIDYVGLSFRSPWMEKAAADVFTGDVLQVSSGMFDLGGFSPIVVIALVIGWFCMWYCIRHGVTSVGKIVKYTVILPVILLVILIARAVTLPGAMDGLSYYLTPDWSKLLDVNVWAAAYGQIFFSLSILFSIMIAYGSYLSKDAEVTKDAMIIGFADAAISFLSGFAAFGTLGYLAQISGVAISDMSHTGIMLAFVTYPEALGQMPGGSLGVILFSLVFFLMLFTLAIDSAFSIMEAIITAVVDKFGWNKEKPTFEESLREEEISRNKKEQVVKLVKTLNEVKKIKVKELVDLIESFQPIELEINDRTILAAFDKYSAKKNVYTRGNSTQKGFTFKINNIKELPSFIKNSSYDYSKLEKGKDTKQHKGVKEWHYFKNNVQ